MDTRTYVNEIISKREKGIISGRELFGILLEYALDEPADTGSIMSILRNSQGKEYRECAAEIEAMIESRLRDTEER